MSTRTQATRDLYQQLKREAEEAGYNLNPDVEFTLDLVEGLVTNQQRYGYPSCPCRLAQGERAADRDIICPCDYRDADLNEWGACYCALYVSAEIAAGQRQAHSIPERRPVNPDERTQAREAKKFQAAARESAIRIPKSEIRNSQSAIPVWRCRVCGYLCAREQPPEVCPICKAKRERFERFFM